MNEEGSEDDEYRLFYIIYWQKSNGSSAEKDIFPPQAITI